MPWFVRLAVVMVVIPSVVLAMDHLRRRGLPRLPKLRLPSFGRGSRAVPERFALQVAKTVGAGAFVRLHFGKKPHVDSFPRQYACPHCGGRTRYPWNHPKARGLLGDITELAHQIGQRRFCLRCLEQLSDIAKLEKEHLKELDRKDPQSLSPTVSRRVVIPLFLGAIFFPPLLVPATLTIAVRKRGFYWVPFIFTTGFFLCLVVLALAVLGLPPR
ncbi:hypothetical protein CO059_02600 [candidate division WWE3 bacterium CG_4_9_14_0_2_um_filter_48_10]|uniref:Uncharacterized protein n=1 Tax=candidate division WWE3 bacterium CG_4_9_14_0_2_um_filter_48_10 TaxID=1975078 RepID=A0A2M8EIH5_UNCKA|nr:MAG: hypothetical protein CO059_02600 [candidate division WWE3 bacterium CG_4_9_14_0_2_um_filter_48_10]